MYPHRWGMCIIRGRWTSLVFNSHYHGSSSREGGRPPQRSSREGGRPHHWEDGRRSSMEDRRSHQHSNWEDRPPPQQSRRESERFHHHSSWENGRAPRHSSREGGRPQNSSWEGGRPPRHSSREGGRPHHHSSWEDGRPPRRSSREGERPQHSKWEGGRPPRHSSREGGRPHHREDGRPPRRSSREGGRPHHHSNWEDGHPPRQSSRDGEEDEGGEGDGEGGGYVSRASWKRKQEKFGQHIANLVKKGYQIEAVEVLEQMKKARVHPSVVTYNTLLAGYGKKGDYIKAFKTFNELKKKGLSPTDHTYSSMFSACGRGGALAYSTLQKVLAEMERREVTPNNSIVTNSLISALASCDQPKEAMQAYLDMTELGLKPDLYTFSGLLLAASKDMLKGVEVSRQVWGEMRERECEVDLYTYNMALQILRDSGLGGVVKEEALSPAAKPLLTKVVPQVSTHLLKDKAGLERSDGGGEDKAGLVRRGGGEDKAGLVRRGGGEDKAGLVRRGGGEDKAGLVRRGGGEDKAGLERNGCGEDKAGVVSKGGGEVVPPPGCEATRHQEDRTESVLDQVKLRWLRASPPQTTLYVKAKVDFSLTRDHTLVLHVGSLHAGGSANIRWLDKNSIEHFFSALKQSRLKPDIHTFHLLMHLTLDPGHLLVTMKERKVVPDAKLMSAAITQQARRLGNIQGGKVLLDYSRDTGIELGQAGYQALATSCKVQKDGMILLKRMKDEGVVPDVHVLGVLVGHAVRSHRYEYLTALVRVMMQLNTKPDATMIEKMDMAAFRSTKDPAKFKRLTGFKGFYTIWKNKVCPELQSSNHDDAVSNHANDTSSHISDHDSDVSSQDDISYHDSDVGSHEDVYDYDDLDDVYDDTITE